MPSAFALPARLKAKAVPALVADDERHFAALTATLTDAVADTERRLSDTRLRPGGSGEQALERDLEIHRLSARLRLLRRFGLDACLGRMVDEHGAAAYIGRFGLSAADGTPLLIDWRAPAAARFFAATHAQPQGLTSRRRYRWTGRVITDYWDEVFAADGLDHTAALDDQSAFIASLGANRSPRMRDVLATIQSDQDAIIRASSRGALVVDGGPGTGKTVVALHRAAYLLYADPRLQAGRGGILFVGPHQPYLAYIDDVLPSLGEDGALTCTLADLVPGAAALPSEPDAVVRRLKADGRLVAAVDTAVRLWQRIPTRTVAIDTAWGVVDVRPADWAEIFADAGETTHNEVHASARGRLLDLLTERIERERDDVGRASADDGFDADGWGDASPDRGRPDEDFDAYGHDWDDHEDVRAALENDEQVRQVLHRSWPLLDPDALLQGLLTTPQLLHRCAPWLSETDLDVLCTAGDAGRTDADIPLIDAARLAVGDPGAELRRRRAQREQAATQRRMSEVVTDLIAADDGDLKIMSMLRGQDLRRTLVEADDAPADPLAGPFAHIIVDEAQELSDAQWRMLLRRCPSRSFTIVGDRAQARHGFADAWPQRLERAGLRDIDVAQLSVNYRTPAEVMAVAEPVIRAAVPDANVPASIRRSGVPVRRGRTGELDRVLGDWLDEHAEGVAAVISADGRAGAGVDARVQALTPVTAKGLEFDLVVLLEQASTATARAGAATIEAAVDRYVSMTRATRELVLLT